ncbi:hypothetical protein NQZ68_026883 [Dissostichus eleginoides]|nr:hypothetical protein NQZ68_026883 [Dissostichus eleginoides]
MKPLQFPRYKCEVSENSKSSVQTTIYCSSRKASIRLRAYFVVRLSGGVRGCVSVVTRQRVVHQGLSNGAELKVVKGTVSFSATL